MAFGADAFATFRSVLNGAGFCPLQLRLGQGFPWRSYSITVQTDGASHFDGIPHANETNDTDAYQQDFTMSDANRQKVFELAQKLHYFQGDYDSHLKHVAQTGKKILQYRSAQTKVHPLITIRRTPMFSS